VQKKVKSIQVFRKPVEIAVQGDRCGLCLTNFESKSIERGLVCSPNYVKTAFGVLIDLNFIKYYKNPIKSGSLFHITICHETLLGKLELFALKDLNNNELESEMKGIDFSKEYIFVNELSNDEFNANYNTKMKYFAFIDFDTQHGEKSSVLSVRNGLLIGSKLDTDIHLNQCRIAFYGTILHSFTNKDFKTGSSTTNSTNSSTSNEQHKYLHNLKIFKEKSKQGVVERKHDEYTLICKSMFKKETKLDLFAGYKVKLSTGEQGVIEGSFGQSGKIKIRIPGKD
jgi:selenocysteine-specific elongation factor